MKLILSILLLHFTINAYLIRTDDVRLLELHKSQDINRFGFESSQEDTYNHSNLINFPTRTTHSAYNPTYSSKGFIQEQYSHHENQSNTNGNGNYNYIQPKIEKVEPKTPSPAINLNKVKLDSLNSFPAHDEHNHEHEFEHGHDSTKEESDLRMQSFDNSGQSSRMQSKHKNSDHELSEEQTNSKKKAKTCCNCKKSRCLKLYCDCFGRGQPCAKECNCLNCLNTEAHHKERKQAMASVLEKNPSAFKPKVDRTLSPEKVQITLC